MERKTVSSTIIALLLISVLISAVSIQLPKASGTICNRAGDSIDPSATPLRRGKETCTITDNLFATANASALTVSNTILEVEVENETGEGGVGTYTVRTGESHPNPFENVLFGGHDLHPWSSYNTIKVYDTNREYVTSSNPYHTPDQGFTLVNLDDCNPTIDIDNAAIVRIHWDTFENLRIYQEVGVLGTSVSDTLVYISMWIHNNDIVVHNVSFRFLWDLMIADWDGSWLRPEASGPWLDTETEWTPPTFGFWEATNYPPDSAFYIYGLHWSTPAKMIFGYWGSSYQNAYLYTPTGQVIGSPVPSTGGTLDSAVLYYWQPVELSPGGETSVRGDIPTPLRGGAEYDVTIRGHCNTDNADVSVDITMDGSPTIYTTPYTFADLAGTHTFTVPNADSSDHAFWRWSDGETSTTITVGSGGAYVAYYGAQVYDVTIKGHCNAEGVDVSVNITMDGSPTGNMTQYTFTGLTGAHTFTVPNVDSADHVFHHWSGGETSTTIAVSFGGTYTAYYGGVHDVAITNVQPSKTIVGQGYDVNLTVTVANQGQHVETFNVNVYYGNSTLTLQQRNMFWSMGDVNRDGYINLIDAEIIMDEFGWSGPPGQNPADINSDGEVNMSDAFICASHYSYEIWEYFISGGDIETRAIIGLPPEDSITITFEWNTTGIAHGNYVISAYAWPVPNETDTQDNNLSADEEVCVTIPGDLDADFDVDLYDAVALLARYGARIGLPEYRPNCDIDNDGDIDLYDAVALLSHYGQADP